MYDRALRVETSPPGRACGSGRHAEPENSALLLFWVHVAALLAILKIPTTYVLQALIPPQSSGLSSAKPVPRVPGAVLPPPGTASTPPSLTPTSSPVSTSRSTPMSSRAIDLTLPSPAKRPNTSPTTLDMHSLRPSVILMVRKFTRSRRQTHSCVGTRPPGSSTL